MIDIESVVIAAMYLIGIAAIFGLLFGAVIYFKRKWPGNEIVQFICNCLEVFLVLAAVFVLIFFIMDMMGHPILQLKRKG